MKPSFLSQGKKKSAAAPAYAGGAEPMAPMGAPALPFKKKAKAKKKSRGK